MKPRGRFILIQAGLIAGYGLIIGRALFLMLQDNQKLEKIALQQYRTSVQSEAGRSRILDRKGKELAMDKPVWSLYADPAEVRHPYQTSAVLSKKLKISQKDLRGKLKSNRRFVWIQRRVEASTIEAIRPLQLEGIYVIKENKRYYPQGPLAGHVLGAVGLDSKALGGIELAYDHYLMRHPVSGVYMKDAKGRLYLASTRFAGTHPKGDLYLTIDKGLQFLLEESLERTVRKHAAKGGSAVMLDPATGAVLGLANYPFFNPNHFDEVSLSRWRNRAVTDLYEPGSTFKLVFLAAALEDGALSLNESIDCEGGRLQLPTGNVIHDSKPHGRLTPPEIIKVSSNIGAYKIARRLGPKRMDEWIRAFGFGQRTGIDFPSEAAGIVRPHRGWSMMETATISFGQAVGTTPLQIASFYAAIANDGAQMKPYLVEKVVSPEGDLLYQSRPEILHRPITAKTSQRLKEILKGAVLEGGTGQAAFLAEYPVAGKTGTSQKSEPGLGYLPGRYVATFVGFAPADRPRLVLLVLIDEPSHEQYTGSQVAAPPFKEMMLRALQYVGVPPARGGGLPVMEAHAESMPRFYAERKLKTDGDSFEVPDFKGATLRHVLRAVTHFPVEVEFKGRGVAYQQDPEPGSWIAKGSRIYVAFKPLY
ncbi:MAG: hypothetical protein HY609_07120 [Deltaproteobacteria bacterium]|nr:hypothetical protein [Deltaproteobacteria bacterium]MBI4224691.1 hypothetical protein [Deltaproteobacteria bacterium]